MEVLRCSLVLGVVVLIVVQQRFCICYSSTCFFFCNVESTKICVVGHSHPSLIMCYEIESNATFLFPNQIPKSEVTFRVSKEFVFQLTMKLKHFMEKKTCITGV